MVNIVHKFGGSSLSSADRYHAVANIVLANTEQGDCVVVSASGKTTDTLVKLWQSYQQQDRQAVSDILLLIDNNQRALIEQLLTGQNKQQALAQLNDELAVLNELISQQQLLEAPLLAHGEVWSARLLAAYLNQLGVAAQDVDARQLFTLNDGQLLHQKNQQQCTSIISKSHINVVTGFIAVDCQGNTVTLGRNGSDYSATLLASYTFAKQVSIWTDTQGVFSTDPRKVKNALKYGKVCREQANLLARLGNPVLHAKTLSPLKGTKIKLVVRSSFDCDATPTEVVKEGYSKAKRFITTLDNIDLLRVDKLSSGEVGELSQLIQHSLHHFTKDGDTYLLVPGQSTHQVVGHLAGRANIVESNLSGCAVVAPTTDVITLTDQATALLKEQSIHPRFVQQDDNYVLILNDQAIDSDVLTLLHDKLVNKGQELAIIVAGLGNVGEVFLSQLQAQFARLSAQYKVKVVALLRSKQMLFSASGLNTETWQEQWHNEAQSYNKAELLARINELDYEHKVVIDITASEAFSQFYPDFIELNCHLISANKYAGTAASSWYQTLRNNLAERNLLWRYNTSVGAGLPINFALADLQNSGDRINRIEGVFSGTLSWLCSSYDGSVPFSDLVLQAQQMGYTEPDPREDLSGRDMQRKLLILARDLGLDLELDDIALTPLMPEALAIGSWQDFLANKQLLDDFMTEKANLAAAEDKVVRYTGAITLVDGKVKAQVGLVNVGKDDVLAGLKPGDNIFVINSQWYLDNALVIQGPGAGKEVTAAGIHSDLYWLVNNLK
ncbi:bifunctional aspartate kinase/homoserine dehydrogenase II [Pseudoalteromonas shioyasakiensis]|uniref:bifunctional aspartate kinase/homoserine dehydrogenase II n=1 Tax=Pseudoalteromonas shioyasakiensis TaxID=1190813 RepID=UPI002117723E|nr:bifunctional aspartate kinase/homoserine dehydrogenase II [Pseudoalteromonas shioyasakiensis]MCQ8882996.1 bifunctional aspartate kinase/homoserine dehydrogenase II [Pseudoalteromonas shioyasakiensis]